MAPDTGIRDAVTGLYVREYFDDVIDRELERSRRHGSSLSVVSVVLVDRDDLAARSEEAADAVLAEAARALQRNVRETDLAFRWEDDELLVLLYEANAAACAQKVAQLDELFRPWRDGGGPVPVAVKLRIGGATHENGIVFASTLQAARASTRPDGARAAAFRPLE